MSRITKICRAWAVMDKYGRVAIEKGIYLIYCTRKNAEFAARKHVGEYTKGVAFAQKFNKKESKQ